MRKTLQLFYVFIHIISVVENYSLNLYLIVKRLSTFLVFHGNYEFNYINIIEWRQSAWLYKYIFFNNHQRLNIEQPNNIKLIQDHSKSINRSKLYNNKENFYLWLVGVTDGDGSFSIYRQELKKGKFKWSLFFKIGQSSYNLRMLYFIKKELGYGSVYIESKTNMADFRIRDINTINKILFPIFDKYSLLTSKYFDYLKFKEAYDILINPNIDKKEKNNLLLILKNKRRPDNFISPIWKKINYLVKDTSSAKCIMNKYWLVGFTEAEGSFYITKKSSKRFVHGFEITQKLDSIILDSIARILGMSVYNKNKYNTVVTTNSRAIHNIIEYYKNTMKGMKALEYRIWAKSFIKHKGNFDRLDKVRKLMRKIKSIRLDKSFQIKNYDNDIK